MGLSLGTWSSLLGVSAASCCEDEADEKIRGQLRGEDGRTVGRIALNFSRHHRRETI
jgi:hypothetical protein